MPFGSVPRPALTTVGVIGGEQGHPRVGFGKGEIDGLASGTRNYWYGEMLRSIEVGTERGERWGRE